MDKTIKKYYLIQLGISFIICIVIINLIGLINEIDENSKYRLILLSIVGSLLFLTLNALINSLNFTFNQKKNKFIAFYLPILIWCVLIAFVGTMIKENREFNKLDWAMILIWLEPIAYNLKLKKAVANTKK